MAPGCNSRGFTQDGLGAGVSKKAVSPVNADMEMTLEKAVTHTAGDGADPEVAFDRLLAAQRRRLYGIAYSILRDSGEAEDALQ